MPISKDLLRTLRPTLQAALDKVAADHGLQSLTAGNMSFSADNFTVTVKGIAKDGKSREAVEYETACIYAPQLPKLGAEFRWSNRTFKPTGLKRTKVSVLDVHDGKTYLIKLEALEARMSLAKQGLQV
jgi:hypothetical protein